MFSERSALLQALKLAAAFAAVLASSAFLGACGSDDEESATTVATSNLTKAQYVKKASAICEREAPLILPRLGFYYKEYERRHDLNSRHGNETAIAVAIKVILPRELHKQIDQIRALGAPSGDEERIEAFLAAMETDAEEVEGGSIRTLEALRLKHSPKLASAYGLIACSYS